MVSEFGWAFVLFSTVFVVFVLVVALSRFGTIRLGAADEKPEFRTASWIAMMFAAGMGIGLVFYGASEPLIFFRDGVPGHGTGDVSASMSSALFHWTLPPPGRCTPSSTWRSPTPPSGSEEGSCCPRHSFP